MFPTLITAFRYPSWLEYPKIDSIEVLTDGPESGDSKLQTAFSAIGYSTLISRNFRVTKQQSELFLLATQHSEM